MRIMFTRAGTVMMTRCSSCSLKSAVQILLLLTLGGSLILYMQLSDTSHKLRDNLDKAKRESQQTITKTVNSTFKSFDPFGQQIKKKLKNDTINTEQVQQNKPAANISNPAKPKRYDVNWNNPPPYLKLRPDSFGCDFKPCKYNNCYMTFDIKNSSKADAVLFDGRRVLNKVGFERPPGQIWIFAAHEAPTNLKNRGRWWTRDPWHTAFNWTMTYDKTNSDIYLPYGELLKKTNPPPRDFKQIAMQKTKGVLMINSHCRTKSRREKYVDQLKEQYDVTVLGSCGTRWNCGKHYVHDDCFNILNTTYQFFLSFENAFCRQYFSEKFYENFNYDIILITRGGDKGDAKQRFPKGTYISTDDFKYPKGLAAYLNKLSWSPNDYAALLKEKSNYFSPGYKHLYQRALCDLCERLNHQDQYQKVIPDITKWAYHSEPCKNATDL